MGKHNSDRPHQHALHQLEHVLFLRDGVHGVPAQVAFEIKQ
jgi:hypothetical protein